MRGRKSNSPGWVIALSFGALLRPTADHPVQGDHRVVVLGDPRVPLLVPHRGDDGEKCLGAVFEIELGDHLLDDVLDLVDGGH